MRSDEGTTVGLAVGCCQGLSHRLIGKLNPAQGGSCAKPVQTRKLPEGSILPTNPSRVVSRSGQPGFSGVGQQQSDKSIECAMRLSC